MVLDASTVRTVLGMLQGPRIDSDAWVDDILIEEDDEGIDITVSVGTEESPTFPSPKPNKTSTRRLGARPDAVVRIAMNQPPIRRVVAKVAHIAGYGWAAFSPVPPTHPVRVSEDTEPPTLSNGLVSVVVDEADGTFAIYVPPGYGRLVDGGDLGDSYNYSPPAQDSLVDTPTSVTCRVTEWGPVRARAELRATYTRPSYVDGATQARVGAPTRSK